MQQKYQKDLKTLTSEKEELAKELEATLRALKLEKENTAELEERVGEAEEEARQNRKTQEKNSTDLRSKVCLRGHILRKV